MNQDLDDMIQEIDAIRNAARVHAISEELPPYNPAILGDVRVCRRPPMPLSDYEEGIQKLGELYGITESSQV
jgi:hypothetical protein